MASERVMCKQCGETDTNRLIYSDDRRSIFCKVCRTTTSLVEVVVHEHTGEIKMEGIQGFSEQLNNANNLLHLGYYDKAREQFMQLTEKYSSRYETWFGLARVQSHDFDPEYLENLNNFSYIYKLLDNAASCGQNNEAIVQKVKNIEANYEKRKALEEAYTKKKEDLENKIEIAEEARLSIRSTYINSQSDKDTIIHIKSEAKHVAEKAKKRAVRAALYLVLFLIDYAIALAISESSISIPLIIEAIVFIPLLVLPVLFIKNLLQAIARARDSIKENHECRIKCAEISSRIAKANAHNDQVSPQIKSAEAEVNRLERELKEHIASYARLSSK